MERLLYRALLGILEPRMEQIDYKHSEHLGVYVILMADVPSKVLQIGLLQFLLFNLHRYTIHNAIVLNKQFNGFLNLEKFFITESVWKKNKTSISKDLKFRMLIKT